MKVLILLLLIIIIFNGGTSQKPSENSVIIETRQTKETTRNLVDSISNLSNEFNIILNTSKQNLEQLKTNQIEYTTTD